LYGGGGDKIEEENKSHYSPFFLSFSSWPKQHTAERAEGEKIVVAFLELWWRADTGQFPLH
jgi:hypothetical protein